MNLNDFDKYSDVKRDAVSLKNNVIGLAGEIESKAGESLSEAGSVARAELEKMKERAVDELHTVYGFVRKKPLQSLAMAFAAGAILNFFAGRR